ncbi:MAG TPA: retention module-containing protein, partial [Methylophilaceae bacterium]|nr:retention module-containing protein [Methylophilaceae bacterium]
MAKLGTVVAITGTAFIQNESGQQKALKLGDTVQPGDTIITARGVTVELEMVGDKHVIIAGDQIAKLTDEVGNMVQADIADSAINQATIDAVLKAIEEGRDINEVLEETAAGLNGGLTNTYGFSFVNLLRIIENLDPFSFQLESASGVSNDFSPLQLSDDISLGQDNGASAGTPAGGTSASSPNNAPSATFASVGAAEDAPMLAGTLSALATDPDGDPLTYSVVGVAPPGMLVNSNGTFSFDYSDSAYQHLKAGETEIINVTWQTSDGKGGTDTAILQITVTGTNDAPVAVASIVPATEDNATTFDPRSSSVTDVDGDPLTITEIAGLPIAVGTPVILPEGVVTLNLDGSLTFTPNPDFNGPANFSYTVS